MGRGPLPEFYMYKSWVATAIHILPRGGSLLASGPRIFRQELLEHGYAACVNYVLRQHVVDAHGSEKRAPEE